MADSISIKDRKLQKRQEKLKFGDSKQKNNEEMLEQMTTEVANGFRSSKLKRLSNKEKNELRAEYERIITKLKELEFRNKKREGFKYKFKGLKYFKTLNGHTVYSESMNHQARSDKSTISAMMAYNQLGAGFDVTFEEFVKYVRPERRREFFARCAHSPALSYNLMGMAKLIEYYNQRDFTRAFAAMAFFGLENDLDLMQEFLKVRFDANFYRQVENFKDEISKLDNFEAKNYRDEAGNKVFSQSRAFAVDLKSSISGKSAGELIQEDANVKSQEYEKKAQEYQMLMDKHNGNFMGVGVESALNEMKKVYERTEKQIQEKHNEIDKAAKEVFGENYNDPQNIRIVEELKRKAEERGIARAKSEVIKHFEGQSNTSIFEKFKEQLEKANTPEEKEAIKKELEDFVNSEKLGHVQRLAYNRIYDAENKRRQKISEKSEIEAKLSKATPEEKPKLEEQLKIVEEELSKIPTFEQIVAELCKDSRLPAEEVENISKQFKEIVDKLFDPADYTKPMAERNGFEAWFEYYKDNEKKLDRELTKLKRELIEEKNPEKIAEIEGKIERIKTRLNELIAYRDGKTKVSMTMKKDRILSILSGEQLESKDFDLILKSKNIKDEDKQRINNLKQNGIPEGGLSIEDKELVDSLFVKSLVEVYNTIVKCTRDKSYSDIAEEMLGDIGEKIFALYAKREEIRSDDLESQESKDKKISEIDEKIEFLKKAQRKIQQAKGTIQKQQIKELAENEKPPEVILENKLTHVVEFKLTNKDGQFIDELGDEELKKYKITDESILKSVTTIIEGLEKITDLKVETISRENMNRLEKGLQRCIKLLDKLKGKIPDEDFGLLEEKSKLIQTKLKQLSKKVSEESKENNEEQKESAEKNENNKEECLEENYENKNNQIESNEAESISKIEAESDEKSIDDSNSNQVNQENQISSDSLLNETEYPPKEIAGKTGLKENNLNNQNAKS